MMNDDDTWRDQLSPEEYRICRQKGTEAPFSGSYNDNKRQGEYRCKCCATALFNSAHKYDSGSGWPSFDRPAQDGVIGYIEDASLGMNRIEAECRHCGCHLGHVFDDGPKDTTGKRYCINSASLDFIES